MKQRHSKKTSKFDALVDSFVNKLEAGVTPWIQPYKANAANMIPKNYSTGKPYRGINILVLWMCAMDKGYSSRYWLTFNQTKALGGSVRRGEKGTRIFFWSPVESDDQEQDSQDTYTKWIMRVFTVFNMDQIDGIEDPDVIDFPAAENERIEAAEKFISRTGATILERGSVPCYSPTLDEIHMPPLNSFRDTPSYYASLLHEGAHWTGHESRLDRPLRNAFGTAQYAYEELVAEMASAFLCSHLGIPLEGAQHPEYLGHWATSISDNPRILYRAASKAQVAFDYITALADDSSSSHATRADCVSAA